MALTKKQALINCRKMWQFIADNDAQKNYAADTLWPNKKILFNCWACEYTKDTKPKCKNCPLWPAEEYGFAYCESSIKSPYAKWQRALSSVERRNCALEIVQLCNEKLKVYRTKE